MVAIVCSSFGLQYWSKQMSAIELPGVNIDRIFVWERFFCSSRALSVIALRRARGVRFFVWPSYSVAQKYGTTKRGCP